MTKNINQKRMRHEDFVVRLAAMMAEAGELGLYGTMHKIHEAVQALGWELSHKNYNAILMKHAIKGNKKKVKE